MNTIRSDEASVWFVADVEKYADYIISSWRDNAVKNSPAFVCLIVRFVWLSSEDMKLHWH